MNSTTNGSFGANPVPEKASSENPQLIAAAQNKPITEENKQKLKGFYTNLLKGAAKGGGTGEPRKPV